jgi:hypothetical protein
MDYPKKFLVDVIFTNAHVFNAVEVMGTGRCGYERQF